MLQVINTLERILTAANYFILFHRYDILMLSLLSWFYLGGNVGIDFLSWHQQKYGGDDDDNDHDGDGI